MCVSIPFLLIQNVDQITKLKEVNLWTKTRTANQPEKYIHDIVRSCKAIVSMGRVFLNVWPTIKPLYLSLLKDNPSWQSKTNAGKVDTSFINQRRGFSGQPVCEGKKRYLILRIFKCNQYCVNTCQYLNSVDEWRIMTYWCQLGWLEGTHLPTAWEPRVPTQNAPAMIPVVCHHWILILSGGAPAWFWMTVLS